MRFCFGFEPREAPPPSAGKEVFFFFFFCHQMGLRA